MTRAARIAIAALGVAVVAIVILVVALVEHVGEGDQTATKRVLPEEMRRYDTTVILPSAVSAFTVGAVEDRMNRLAAVQQYAEVPRSTLAFLFSRSGAQALSKRVCSTPSTRGYAVALATPTSDSRRRLTEALGDDVTVASTPYTPPQTEIFMQVRATDRQARAVEERLRRDPDVVKYRFLDHKTAFEEFARLFGDQPDLIKSEPADGSSLPESFRLDVREDASLRAVAARYENLPGVDMVNLPPRTVLPSTALFDPERCGQTR